MAERESLAEEPNTGWLLNAAAQRYLARINEGLLAAGYRDIRPAHGGNVFAHLPAEGARLSELAARARIANQSMSYLVDYLEAHGYLERVSDPTDARAKLIRLTEQGRAVERDAVATIARLEAAGERRLGADKMRELRHLLAAFLAALEDQGT